MPFFFNAFEIENNTALPKPPPANNTCSPNGISVGEPVGPITTRLCPGFRYCTNREDAPISSTIMDNNPLSGSVQAPVIANASIVKDLPSIMIGSVS